MSNSKAAAAARKEPGGQNRLGNTWGRALHQHYRCGVAWQNDCCNQPVYPYLLLRQRYVLQGCAPRSGVSSHPLAGRRFHHAELWKS